MDTDGFVDALDGHFAASALIAAMETGLFWDLAERARNAEEVAAELDFEPGRCRYWLQVLQAAGWVCERDAIWEVSASVRSAVIDRYSRQSWAMLASLARQRQAALLDLRDALAGGAVTGAGWSPAQVAGDPDLAVQFTHMLYEFHRGFAQCIAECVDLDDVSTAVDLGGGSGVVAMALCDRKTGLGAIVADLGHICDAGRRLAQAKGYGGRIEYRELDILADPLPASSDLFIECDVGVYSESLFRRVRESLNPGGRFVVVDKLAPAPGVAPASRAHWALLRSLFNTGFSYRTADGLAVLANKGGLELRASRPLPIATGDALRFSAGFTLLEFVRA